MLNYPSSRLLLKNAVLVEHNEAGQDLQVRLQVFTVTGRPIKNEEKTINTSGNRSNDLEGDGSDE